MESGGERWDIVSLPAEAEPGDLLGREPGQWLWDDAYGYGERLREEKATQLPRNWSALYQQRPAPDTVERAAASNAQHLWRIGLRRHLGWRRLHRARRYRRRPGKPHVSARSLAGADLLRYLDRGLVRFGEKMEAVVLGRGARADHFRRGPVPRAARDRAPRLHSSRAVPKPRRQGRARAIDAWPHGDARPRGRMAMLGLYVRQGAPWLLTC